MSSEIAKRSREPALPEAPVIVVSARHVTWLDPDGTIDRLDFAEARRRLRDTMPILVHAPAIRRRIGLAELACFDLLELFAFVLPARTCLPTLRGLLLALDLDAPASHEDQAVELIDATRFLLRQAAAGGRGIAEIAGIMNAGGWSWGPAVLRALGSPPPNPPPQAGEGFSAPSPVVTGEGRGGGVRRAHGLAIWQFLPEWEETGLPDPPSQYPVEPAAARTRLAEIIAKRAGAEPRPQQSDYASAATAAFQPRDLAGHPRLVLAEAGTGVGKTLGYLAPATLWAERNEAPVWISTYTRNLQTQVDEELDGVFPDPAEKRARVVVRKGRENYLCLLNLEDAVQTVGSRLGDARALGLMARWASATDDGALTGSDFPGWLPDLVHRPLTLGLADRRGECIHSACQHYTRCFIEHGVRRARRAAIVVGNHALVLTQAALGGLDDAYLPTRYVFDEGHHLFDAADSAFSAHLTGVATAEFRRWLLGVETGPGRARGLKRRMEDLLAGDETALRELVKVLVAAAGLPAYGWQARLVAGEPHGPIEHFLLLVHTQVLARSGRDDSFYDLEAERHPVIEALPPAAKLAAETVERIETPLKRLAQFLTNRLDSEADELDRPERIRIEAMLRSLERRALLTLAAWRAMLADLQRDTPDSMSTTMVDWLSISRLDGRDVDVGLHRHWIDPTLPLAAAVLQPAHGVLVTSATLTDGGDIEAGWQAAEARTGARHLSAPAIRARVPSPFDYAAQTRAFIVTDLRREEMRDVAAAYRELFLAAGGGALGLFTAISRLKAVHEHLAVPLDEAGVALLAQHVDGLDAATLIDIFRAEENSCLLGTDAIRDGVDVPGRSLRLIVFDRVPWPRPGILHKARRRQFGGAAYDDHLTRLKLRQAFGRLIRRADDRGVFVLLDRMMPSRLTDCLPEGVPLSRVGLAEAIAETKAFVGMPQGVETPTLVPYSEAELTEKGKV